MTREEQEFMVRNFFFSLLAVYEENATLRRQLEQARIEIANRAHFEQELTTKLKQAQQ